MTTTISSFGKPHTIKRQGPGAYDGPRWTAGSETDVPIIASIQPMDDGRRAELLPAGDREKDAIQIFTETELFVTDDQTQTKADRLQYFGRTYEVRGRKNWTETDMPHWECGAVMVQK